MTIEIDEHGRGLVVTTVMMMVAMVTENLMAVTVPAMLAWGGTGCTTGSPTSIAGQSL